jgi:uncharacterized protein
MMDDKQICFIVKVTTRCNLACSYCYEEKTDEDMDLSVVESLTQKALAATSRVQFCWHGGETLLRGISFYEEVVSCQKRFRGEHNKILNTLQTNGLLLDEDWYAWFSGSGFRVGISCDGPTCHDINRKTIAGNGSFKNILTTLSKMRETKNDRLCGGLLAVVTPEMLEHSENLLEEFILLGVKKLDFLRYKAPDGGLSIEEYYGFIRSIFNQWLKLDDSSLKIRTIDSTLNYFIRGKSRLCRYLGDCKRFLTVRPNGDVYPCECLHGSSMYLKLGNILLDDLNDIYRKAGQVIKQHELPPSCSDCFFTTLCRNACAGAERLEGVCLEKKMFFRDIFNLVQTVREKNVNAEGRA